MFLIIGILSTDVDAYGYIVAQITTKCNRLVVNVRGFLTLNAYWWIKEGGKPPSLARAIAE